MVVNVDVEVYIFHNIINLCTNNIQKKDAVMNNDVYMHTERND